MQNKKMVAIPILLMIALSMIGFTYATWSQTLYINGTVSTGTLSAKFVPPVTKTDQGLDWNCDDGLINVRQIDKDIGSSTATIVADKEITVVLTNVYPCYYEHISFWIHNDGTIPWKIQKVIFYPGGKELHEPDYLTLDLNGDTYADIEIYWGDSFGIQREYCEKLDISFEIHILEKAPQGATLTFTIEIVIVQWNKYVPP